MLKVLVAVDGSNHASRAIDYMLGKLRPVLDRAEIHLLNVQPPVPGGARAAAMLGKQRMKEYHEAEGRAALAPAEKRFKAAGIPFFDHIVVGEPAPCIAEFAKAKGCEQIVMGTRGAGTASVLVGSVAMKVVQLASVPVLLVK